ncbi:response regulator [Chitinophaga niabensis]|uniref:DNA-binding response regulator, NarL/FixJ family, contains REC and HTH domains n=1 Tax=Chitinophaga niabensis TaxID=536979 RepID=A0A1N6K472_9BACT|nr:response regulator transcription factor [Chitinophaga niabensis]SIO51355.1 DNA-binding response regulator, NarL/FixJ family, contains REC and HTH domains [Chitinophaga niabensis]
MLQHRTTLAIVDDHPVVIEGLAKLLSKKAAYEIAGGFTSGQDFLAFFEKTPVKIVLLDIILPDMNGIDLCKEIKRMSPDTVVLALSNHEERGAVMKMLENGASGYLLKNAAVEELMDCINGALNGQIMFSKAVKEIIARPQLDAEKAPVKLTVREKEILGLIASGITTPRIAEMLFLSKFTVENHRKNLLHKLNAKNVAELINSATRQGLI